MPLPPKPAVIGIRLTLLDLCAPDYFLGASPDDFPEVLAIPISGTTSYSELYCALDQEFNSTDGWFDMDNAGTMFDKALAEWCNQVPKGLPHPDLPFYTAEPADEPSDLYAYFGLAPTTTEASVRDGIDVTPELTITDPNHETDL